MFTYNRAATGTPTDAQSACGGYYHHEPGAHREGRRSQNLPRKRLVVAPAGALKQPSAAKALGWQRSRGRGCPRTVQDTPLASTRSTNPLDRFGTGVPFTRCGVQRDEVDVHAERPQLAGTASCASRSARQGWSFVPDQCVLHRHPRRPVTVGVVARAASSTSSTFHRLFTGTKVSRSSSSEVCNDNASVTPRLLVRQLADGRAPDRRWRPSPSGR